MINKQSLSPSLRRALITALIILFMGSAGTAAWWFRQPMQKEQAVTVYTGRQAAAIDYQVYLTPNNYFSADSVGPGLAYITPLTDYLNTRFTYQFAGQKPAQISGSYEVTTALTGYLIREKTDSQEGAELVKLYEKDEVLIPGTAFNVTDNKFNFDRQAAINVRSYVDFINAMAQDLRVSADVVQLDITFHVSSRVSTADGEVIQDLAPVMTIPIEGNTFMVEGKLTDEKETPITIAEMTAISGVKANRTGYSVAALIILILLLGVFFTTKVQPGDPREQELRKIIKKYGDWIAAVQGEIQAVGEKFLLVHSFEDLVKVADEAELPILYESNGTGAHSFYVISDTLVYRYTIK